MESQPANGIKAMKMMADPQKQIKEMKVTLRPRRRTPSRQRRPRPPVYAGMTNRTFAGITKRMVTKQKNVNPTAKLRQPRKTREPESNDDDELIQ